MTAQRVPIEQARVNALKTIRAAIRLKHSIAADEELNRVLPAFEKQFMASVQNKTLPTPVDFKKVLGG